MNGSVNWLSSLSQQSCPVPRISDYRRINQSVRRAKLDKDLSIRFEPIDPKELTVVCHSDAAFAHVGDHTQGGYVIAFTQTCLQDGIESKWRPATWKSYRLPRAVSSALAAEAGLLMDP